MASILYAWEFGANLGHIGTFLPVAKELRNRGHDVHWVVTHPHQAAKLLPDAGFDWLQAPTMPEQRREGPPLNYADILLRFGYSDVDALVGLAIAWRELIRLTGAEVVLADHAPTAILAARTLGIPVMLFGSGFFAPPLLSPTPNMRPWVAVPPQQLVEIDRIAVTTINAVLDRLAQPKLQHVAELFLVEEPTLLIFPELDHYPNRGDAKYWGTLPAAVANPPQWPDATGRRIFAYLRPESAHFDPALQALYASNTTVLIYAPGLPEPLRQHYTRPGLHFASAPVDLNLVSQQADMALTYASPAATIAFLLAGKPVVMIPGHLEQFLFAKRVEEMGAGVILNPEQPASPLPHYLARVLNEPRFRDSAAAFARKYARFNQNEVMTNIVRRIEAIACSTASRHSPGGESQ
jgi:UDP:flavonoid glycosyltransferase YjiC (YdhE family)